jgi:hypothetical protein
MKHTLKSKQNIFKTNEISSNLFNGSPPSLVLTYSPQAKARFSTSRPSIRYKKGKEIKKGFNYIWISNNDKSYD